METEYKPTKEDDEVMINEAEVELEAALLRLAKAGNIKPTENEVMNELVRYTLVEMEKRGEVALLSNGKWALICPGVKACQRS